MLSKKYFPCLILVFFLWNGLVVTAQRRSDESIETGTPFSPPKLVVGIVVDQMRYEYLTRFWNQFGDKGFKRLVKGGFTGKNHHVNYAPTVTAPGHASAYTGTTPSIHGILGNNWYDKVLGQTVYCVSDSTVQAVGTAAPDGQMSPRRLLVSTVTDQLRLHTQMKGKVIAVAIKDRGSVLPGGHSANAAYWYYGGTEGKWISSSYYMEQLPSWVTDYNSSGKINQYKKVWDTQKDIRTYVESGPDNIVNEGSFAGKNEAVFPYDLSLLWMQNGQYDLLKETPFGNDMTTDFALLALEKESLGTDDITDFLAISYSSTDYIGHRFGVDSKEVEDAYIRLDLSLERLLDGLDKKVGEGQYTLFLTADHGAMNVHTHLKELNIPTGYEGSLESNSGFMDFIRYNYGTTDIILNISNRQIFLDHRLMESLDLNPREVQENIATELLKYGNVAQVFTAYQLQHQEYTKDIAYLIQNGYNQKYSGDVFWVASPGYINYRRSGSDHGSPQSYDTHIPLILFGKGIKPGNTAELTELPDIAPTLSVLMGMAYPNGTNGKPINAALK